MQLHERWKTFEDPDKVIGHIKRRIERITGFDEEQLCSLAIHRVITPSLVSQIAEQELGLNKENNATVYVAEKVTKEELPFARLKDIVVATIPRKLRQPHMVVEKFPQVDKQVQKSRALYLMTIKWLQGRGLAQRQEFTYTTKDHMPVTRIWGWHQLTGRDIDLVPRTVALNPEARAFVLGSQPRERLIGFHAVADQMYQFVRPVDEPRNITMYLRVKNDATVIVEKAYHYYSMQMLLHTDVNAHDLYRGVVTPPEDIKAETYQYLDELVRSRVGGNTLALNMMYWQLAFNFIDGSVINPGDPNIQFMREFLDHHGVLNDKPYPYYERQTFGEKELPEVDNLYVHGGYSVTSCSLSEEEPLTSFIYHLYSNGLRKPVKALVLLRDGRGAAQFRTRQGLNIQLDYERWERSSIAAIETTANEILVLRSRSVRISDWQSFTVWDQIATLKTSRPPGSPMVNVEYHPEISRRSSQLNHKLMSVYSGTHEESEAATIAVGTEDEGNIVISNGNYHPIKVNTYNAKVRNKPYNYGEPYVHDAVSIP